MADSGTPEKGLTPAQQRAVAALLSERDTRAAAKLCRVAERTLWRWLGDAAFRAALLESEGQAIDQATRRLIGLQDTAINAILDVFTLADEQARVNISDFISEEPKGLTIGRGENAKQVYIESGALNWEQIRERGHLIKRISFNQYGPILELYDSQGAAGLKQRAAQSVLDYLLKLRELRNIEDRLAALEAKVNVQQD